MSDTPSTQSTSIVERLREVQKLGGDTFSSYEVIGMIGQAADEIARLQAARANEEHRWRTVLEEVVRLRLATNEGTCAQRFDRAWEVARRALEGK